MPAVCVLFGTQKVSCTLALCHGDVATERCYLSRRVEKRCKREREEADAGTSVAADEK